MQTDIDPQSLIGHKAFDSSGIKVGTVDEVYLDDATGAPEWASVRTGFFSRDAFVPLAPSTVEGGALRIPFERALIREAPDFGVGRHLSPDQELQLYRHYGLDSRTPGENPPQGRPTPRPETRFGKIAGYGD